MWAVDVPLPSQAGVVSGLRGSLQRRFSARRVLIAVASEGMTCAWLHQGRWLWTAAHWPDGACSGGLPVQPEPIADLIADTLLDLGLIGARVELLLPLDLCQWRVVDGAAVAPGLPFEQEMVRRLSWSLDPDDSYVSSSDCFGSQLAVGLSRSALQAWIDVFEQADLHLERVDWLLSAAWRGLMRESSQQDVDIVWIVSHGPEKRLILLRDGVPEVDLAFADLDEPRNASLGDFVQVWQESHQGAAAVQWLITAPPSDGLHGLKPKAPGEMVRSTESSAVLEYQSFDPQGEPQLLDPLVSLGFVGLGLEC